MSITLISPLSIQLSKEKKFILNLNNYRNLYFRTLNKSKIYYKDYMKPQIENEVYYNLQQIAVVYKVFKGDARRFDIGNVASIHQKYFEDAFVELGKIEDDRARNIPMTVFCFGGIDRSRPRVEITIYDLKDRTDKAKFFSDLRELQYD